MHRPFAIALFAALLVGRASAGELSIYEHNGSVIDWFIVGDAITATYATPRPGLEDAGVERGATLFKGSYEGNRIVGRAYAFKAGCPAASYAVLGEHVGDRIVLRGPAPHRARNSCAVVGYLADSPHAQLVLKYSSTHH